MQRSITVRVKGFGKRGLIVCATFLTIGLAPFCAQPSQQVKDHMHTHLEDKGNLVTYSLRQALSELYLNRIKKHLASPVLGEIQLTSKFGVRKDPISGEIKKHLGIDLSTAAGNPIIAVTGGQVVKAGWHHTYGLNIEIEHTPKWRTRYAHARLLYVVTGQHVEAGQFIGQVGSTGRSTGPHLHFEVWRNGEPIDPFSVVQVLPKMSNHH
jgi:murein DD-endopeptidase MepM/ murein hydrolase activator NlpD